MKNNEKLIILSFCIIHFKYLIKVCWIILTTHTGKSLETEDNLKTKGRYKALLNICRSTTSPDHNSLIV